MTVLIVIGIFLAGVALDFAAARYTIALQKRKFEIGGRWSAVMCLISSGSLYAFIQISSWMLVPELIGMYLGTIAGGMWQHEREPTGSTNV